jgi:hypothetical protein
MASRHVKSARKLDELLDIPYLVVEFNTTSATADISISFDTSCLLLLP